MTIFSHCDTIFLAFDKKRQNRVQRGDDIIMFTQRRTIVFVLVGILALLLVVGGIYAFLTAQTTERTNRFVFFNDGLQIDIFQPAWYNEGQEMAELIYPGVTIPNDPYIRNMNELGTISHMVAFKVEFVDDSGIWLSPGTMADLIGTGNDRMNINWNSEWERIGGTETTSIQYFIYGTRIAPNVVPPQHATTSLMSGMSVPYMDNDAFDVLVNALNQFGAESIFDIRLTGLAAQGSIDPDDFVTWVLTQ